MTQQTLEQSRKKLLLNEEITLLEQYQNDYKTNLNTALFALVKGTKQELKILSNRKKRIKHPKLVEVLDYALTNQTTFWTAFCILAGAKSVLINDKDPRNWLNITHS